MNDFYYDDGDGDNGGDYGGGGGGGDGSICLSWSIFKDVLIILTWRCVK